VSESKGSHGAGMRLGSQKLFWASDYSGFWVRTTQKHEEPRLNVMLEISRCAPSAPFFSGAPESTGPSPEPAQRRLRLLTPVLSSPLVPQERRFGDAGDAALAEAAVLLPRQRPMADEGCSAQEGHGTQGRTQGMELPNKPAVPATPGSLVQPKG